MTYKLRYGKEKVTYQITFVESSGFVRNGKFPGELGQDFVTDAIVLRRRMTSIIAPNFEEMSRTMTMLPNYWMEIELKVDESRCTDFEVWPAPGSVDSILS